MKFIILFIFAISASVFSQTESAPIDSLKNPSDKKIEFKLSPALIHTFGQTEFELKLTQTVPDTSGAPINLTTRSLLEFPVDAFLIGGSIGIGSPIDAASFWEINFGIYTNLNDPGKPMKDSDWLTLQNYFSETQISYTESDPKLDMLIFNVEAVKQIIDAGHLGIGLLAGYRYQKIEQTAVGYNGWFLDTNFMQSPQSGTEPAIFYRVTYKGPQAGLLARVNLNQSLQLNLKGAASLTSISDFDDHLLRKFHTFADGNGLGILSDFKIRWFSNANIAGHGSYIDFSGGLDHFNADLTQNFEQYADGGPYEQPVGYSTGGLPHEIKSNQYRAGITVGILF